MSQNALALATSGTLSGLAAIEALNAALDTLNTLASGASAPSSPEAGQFWHDTTNNLIKIRSLDNTAWISLGSLDETNHVFSANTKAAPTIYGLTLSNDTTTPTTIIDIAAGGAFDSTASVYIRLATATKKNVTSAFVAGSGNGSLDSGTWTASKFYHVHLIYNATSSAVDILTSLSYTNPVLPSGFTNFVAIGAIYANASSDVAAFTQIGNNFIYASGVQDVNQVSLPTSSLMTLTVPAGVSVQAQFRGNIYTSADGAGAPSVVFQAPCETPYQPALSSASLSVGQLTSGQTASQNGQFSIATNTSSQIHVWGNDAGPTSYSIFTTGFVYPRGLQ